ncbi:MAG: DUF6198 family protein [Methanobacteriaceae archaeon]|nr:DUF6198 family protein [Methanobacteriaceae archaeon]
MVIRIIMLVFGVSIMALGIAISIIAKLGTTPISCVPYVLSLGASYLSVGEWTIVFNVILLLAQFILLKSDFDYKQISQLLIVIIFGYATDFWLWILTPYTPKGYILQWIVCIFGCFVLAFGLIFEVKANLTVLPADGFVITVCKLTKRQFGLTKPYFDVSMVIIGVILSFLFFSYLVGIREGTVFAAITIGYINKGYDKLFGYKIDNYLKKIV